MTRKVRPAEPGGNVTAVKAGEKDYLDLMDEIEGEIVYLIEISALIQMAARNKPTETVPLSNVMDDVRGRLERLKEKIAELQGIFRHKGGFKI